MDGGTNLFYKKIYAPGTQELDENNGEMERISIKNPTFICGDFDSVELNLLDYFKDKGTTIVPTPDQNLTDFTKALKVLGSRLNEFEEVCAFTNL